MLAASETIQNLVADNAKLAKEVMSYARECDRITYYKDNKITDAHQTDAAKDIEAAAINTDAAIAELRAQGVGEFAADMWKRGNELVAEGGQQRLVVQVRLAAKLADTYVDNLRAGRKG